jgi:aerobic-type carbon monoxide dehydrogenase small subunit (CoxS/CutS family)
MDKTISVQINGKSHALDTEGTRSLLQVLREDLALTGTKYGCGEGRCGACTVLVDGRATQACITAIEDVAGSEIVTIEGLATGPDLHPLQEAFVAERAMQCGFCTPGMIMGAASLLQDKPDATATDIIAGMDGHICRCGSYPQILRAIERAVTHRGGQNQ